MRELVNLTARRPFPAPPRRPFSQPRRQINEVRYICASPHTAVRKRAYVFSPGACLSVRPTPKLMYYIYIFSPSPRLQTYTV